METLVLVLGVLTATSASLSVTDPPDGLYTAEGVSYVGCFEHGTDNHKEVLNIQISDECTFNHPESCQTPPTCINSCQSTNPSYVYIGLKHPGHCFCDSALSGVNQMDSANGTVQCDARCKIDLTLACGNSYYMLVYRVDVSEIIPQVTTHVGASTANSVGYTTKPEESKTTPKIANARPQNTTVAIIAGAAAGGAAVLIAGSVVGVCLWRKRRRGHKPSTSHVLQDVNRQTSQPSSDSFSNPAVPPNLSNIDALYAKPDKKRKQKMSSPDDPSYQDVMPTGAQHQYATVNDDHPPNSLAQQGTNPYDSIQNDPQYAVVHKGPRYRPNVDVNPIYMGGETGVSPDEEMSGMTEMVDNVIYE